MKTKLLTMKDMTATGISLLMDNIGYAMVFCNVAHEIIYVNKTAIEKYHKWGGGEILGKSILHCHNENSSRIIQDVFEEMVNGLDEKMTINSPKHRVYMRAVRDADGVLVGYFERYERPDGT